MDVLFPGPVHVNRPFSGLLRQLGRTICDPWPAPRAASSFCESNFANIGPILPGKRPFCLE